MALRSKRRKRPSSPRVFPLAQTIRVLAVAILELGEVLRRERAVLLGDARHVGARVEDPDVLGRWPFWKKMTLAFTPWLYGVNVPRGSRRTVCRLQSCIRISNTSPALSSNRQLSGKTTAARPPGFRIVITCCRKLSCLFDVAIVKSSRSGAWFAPLRSKRRVGQHHVKTLRPTAARRSCRQARCAARCRAGTGSSAPAAAAGRQDPGRSRFWSGPASPTARSIAPPFVC